MHKAKAQRQAEAEDCTHALAAFPLTAGWITDLGFTVGAPPPKSDERDLDDYITEIIDPSAEPTLESCRPLFLLHRRSRAYPPLMITIS